MMTAKELREKDVNALKDELNSLLREQFNLRMQKGMDEIKRSHLYRRVRRSIARVKTLINEKGQA